MLHRWFLFRIHSSSTALATTRKPGIRLPSAMIAAPWRLPWPQKIPWVQLPWWLPCSISYWDQGDLCFEGHIVGSLYCSLKRCMSYCKQFYQFSKYNVYFAVQKVLQFQIFQSFVSPALIVLVIVCCVSTLRLFFPSFQALSQSKQFGK